jgi:predicted negative regulator of RcsB-dependent stress response
MSDLSEQEQVEKLRQWWQENARDLIIAVVVVTGGIFGWYQWQDSKQAYAEGASLLFEQAVDAAEASDLTMLVARHNTLAKDYEDSPYVTQSGLRLAGLYMQRGETADAERVLRETLARERGSLLAPLVASRLARVLIYVDRADEALQVLDGVKPAAYAPLIAEVRGDAYLALGEFEQARQAYQAALDDPGQPQLVDVSLIGMKLAAVPVADNGAP